MANLCKPNSFNFDKFDKIKFKPSEIKNFYIYFKKFSKNGESINIEEFKRSMGILGYKKGNFICERLFDLIDKEGKGKVRKCLFKNLKKIK